MLIEILVQVRKSFRALACEEESMKVFLLGIFTTVLILCLAGCSDTLTGKSDPSPLTFENASRYVVTVYPLTTEWGAFSLVPMAVVEMKNIRDIDYWYEPRTQVQEGSATTERHIIFVDAPPQVEP